MADLRDHLGGLARATAEARAWTSPDERSGQQVSLLVEQLPVVGGGSE